MKHISIFAAGFFLISSSTVLAEGRLKVCLDDHRNAMGERSGQGTYVANVDWGPPPGRSGHLVVGAFDTSHVVWVQRTFGVIRGVGAHDSVRFVVADQESAYPLRFAIYRLNDAAFEGYRQACASGDCYFSRDEQGVELLTNEVRRPRPVQDMPADCPDGLQE